MKKEKDTDQNKDKDKNKNKKPAPCAIDQPKVPEPPPQRKEWEDLTIADDYMFKLVMSHKRICKHLLEMILGIKIRKLMEPKTEHPIKNSYESKGIRLDVYVEDDQNTVYDIEMQVRKYPEAYLGHRTRYYQSVIDFEALDAGVEYNKLKKSIIIFTEYPWIVQRRKIWRTSPVKAILSTVKTVHLHTFFEYRFFRKHES